MRKAGLFLIIGVVLSVFVLPLSGKLGSLLNHTVQSIKISWQCLDSSLYNTSPFLPINFNAPLNKISIFRILKDFTPAESSLQANFQKIMKWFIQGEFLRVDTGDLQTRFQQFTRYFSVVLFFVDLSYQVVYESLVLVEYLIMFIFSLFVQNGHREDISFSVEGFGRRYVLQLSRNR